jgi:hypothetical protein
VNTVRKGNYNKNKARKYYEAQGYAVYAARRGYKGQEVDIFGLFDLCCHKEGYFLLVQVKSNVCPAEVKRQIRDFMVDGHFVKKEILVYKDYSKNNPWVMTHDEIEKYDKV